MTGPFTEIRGVKLLIEESSYIDWLIRSIIESTDSNRTISIKVIMMIVNQWLEAELEASGSIGSEKKNRFWVSAIQSYLLIIRGDATVS